MDKWAVRIALAFSVVMILTGCSVVVHSIITIKDNDLLINSREERL